MMAYYDFKDDIFLSFNLVGWDPRSENRESKDEETQDPQRDRLLLWIKLDWTLN